MMVLKIDHYQTFRNPSPLPWERANRNNLKKTSSEKDGNTNTHDPNHQKKNIKNNCCQIRFRRPFLAQTDTRRLKSDFPDTSN